jgi:hypothetical protein
METPSFALIAWLLIASAINGAFAYIMFARWRTQVLLGGVAVFFAMQCIWMLVYLALSGSTLVDISAELTFDLNSSPFRVAMGQTLLPIVAFVVGARLHSKDTPTTNFLLARANHQKSYSFGFMLCAFALGLLLYFLGTIFVRVPYLTPAIIYAHLSFFMTPLLIGLCWRTYRVPVIIFFFSVLIGGLFAFTLGSRSLLFLPVLFFALGFVFTLPRKGRLWFSFAALVMTVPVLYVSALMEEVRKESTSDVRQVLTGRFSEMTKLAREAGATSQLTDGMARGIGRMLMWSNWVALDFAPERVPYRGFGDLWAEAKFLNKSTLFRDANEYLDESLNLDFGLGVARLFGFSISVGGSVPFAVLADGWSRAGPLGVMLFGTVLCMCWGLAERVIRRHYAERPHYALILITILLSSSYDKMSVYGMIYNLRYLTMQLVLWCTVVYLVSRFLRAPKAVMTRIGNRAPWRPHPFRPPVGKNPAGR